MNEKQKYEPIIFDFNLSVRACVEEIFYSLSPLYSINNRILMEEIAKKLFINQLDKLIDHYQNCINSANYHINHTQEKSKKRKNNILFTSIVDSFSEGYDKGLIQAYKGRCEVFYQQHIDMLLSKKQEAIKL